MAVRTLLVLPALWSVCSAVIPKPTISLVSPQGIRFVLPDIPGATLVALHYSINVPIIGIKSGQWNFDISTKSSDGTWVHQNKGAEVKEGDTVYYWIHLARGPIGYNLLDQSWKAVSADSTAPPPASTAIPANQRYELVFQDDFGSLDPKNWEHEVSLYGGYNREFQAYTPEPENSYVKNNMLYLLPTLTSDRFGENFLTEGVWDLNAMYGRCTISGYRGCVRDGKDGLLNPVMSAKLMSKASIKYGRVEIVAKMPKGDWLWSGVSMMPRSEKYGPWPRSGAITIAELMGNQHYGGSGIWELGSTMHWGIDGARNRWQKTHQRKISLSTSYADTFHKYVVDWTRDYFKILVDDEEVLNVPTPNDGFFVWGNQPGDNIWATGDKNAPFDEDFYLTFNLAVGGTNGFIPDGLNNVGGFPKPWRNSDVNATEKFWTAKDQWYPTWQGESSAMQIKSVKMWQLVADDVDSSS